MTAEGHFRGRVYGKRGVVDGRWVVTSYVPPERRDFPARCVWTESGSTYRLGQPAEDAGAPTVSAAASHATCPAPVT